jgi:hypothetical protein
LQRKQTVKINNPSANFGQTTTFMSAIDNTRTTWNEVTANCCSGDWRKFWPEAYSNLGRKFRKK